MSRATEEVYREYIGVRMENQIQKKWSMKWILRNV